MVIWAHQEGGLKETEVELRCCIKSHFKIIRSFFYISGSCEATLEESQNKNKEVKMSMISSLYKLRIQTEAFFKLFFTATPWSQHTYLQPD